MFRTGDNAGSIAYIADVCWSVFRQGRRNMASSARGTQQRKDCQVEHARRCAHPVQRYSSYDRNAVSKRPRRGQRRGIRTRTVSSRKQYITRSSGARSRLLRVGNQRGQLYRSAPRRGEVQRRAGAWSRYSDLNMEKTGKLMKEVGGENEMPKSARKERNGAHGALNGRNDSGAVAKRKL